MKSFFLNNNALEILSDIRKKKDVTEEELNHKIQTLERELKTAGVFAKDGQLDSMCQMMLETYLKSETRVIFRLRKDGRIITRGYYFADDRIVMLDLYRESGEFMWIPSAKLLVGSVAEAIWDQQIQGESEEYEEEMFENFTEDALWSYDESASSELLLKGVTDSGADNCMIHVEFRGQKASYRRMEDGNCYHGCADRTTLINMLCRWMIRQHRELILKMTEKENDYAV